MQLILHNDTSHNHLMARAGFWCLVLLAISILMLTVFRLVPQIDVMVSDYFFHEKACSTSNVDKRCGVFPMPHQVEWKFIREVGHALPRLLMVAVCLHLTWLLMFNPNKKQVHLIPPLLAIISALAGPLIVVNLMLKEYWGRPRPVETYFFGGDFPYVAPGNMASYCDSNCSFVSGEAAAAFWMLSLVFYFGARNRIKFFIVTGICAIFIALLRVAFGRHYISDVVMSACIVAVVTVFVIWLLQTRIVQGWIAALLRFSNTYAFGKRKMKN